MTLRPFLVFFGFCFSTIVPRTGVETQLIWRDFGNFFLSLFWGHHPHSHLPEEAGHMRTAQFERKQKGKNWDELRSFKKFKENSISGISMHFMDWQRARRSFGTKWRRRRKHRGDAGSVSSLPGFVWFSLWTGRFIVPGASKPQQNGCAKRVLRQVWAKSQVHQKWVVSMSCLGQTQAGVLTSNQSDAPRGCEHES